ncbi:MAG: hypothetical protein BGO11_15100 [Solirubrobacterales bacterium 70-9]|nr:MAG: hypothetical protein BGO11_15100 [Solirubrobacterales bacterium 70-9]
MSATEFGQSILDGIASGSVFAILGVGLGLIVGVTGRFHFAYAMNIVLPIYFATTLISAGLGTYPAIVIGLLLGAAVGVAMEALLYRPLAERAPQAALLAIFVTSLGLLTVCENVIRLIWGSEPRALDPGFTVSRVDLGTALGLNTLQLVWIGVAAVIVVVLSIYLARGKMGRAIRAVEDNPEMAAAVGISPRRVFAVVFAIGAALAGVGGVLFTMQGAALPESGVLPTFTAFVIVFLAGVKSGVPRFALAGIGVGLLQAISATALGPSWSPVVTFGVLFFYVAAVPLRERGLTWRIRRQRVAEASGS